MRSSRKSARRTGKHPPPGARYEQTGDELTLVGIERYDQVQHEKIIAIKDREHTYVIQRRALLGLCALLVEVLVLGLMAMIGIANDWFSDTFALQLLAMTITPSFAAWIIVLRWAFRRGRR